LFFNTELSSLKMTTRLKPFFALALAGAYFTFFSEAFPTDLYSPRPEPRALETTNAENLREHMEAYGLPYGVLGAVSHSLTFYVMLCHFFGLRPLLPWTRLTKHGWNVAAVTISSLVSIILSGVTMARTKGSRPLLILAGMQIVLHVLVDIIHIHCMVGGRSNVVSIWAFPLLVASVFSIYAFYSFPCKLRQSCCIHAKLTRTLQSKTETADSDIS
jgi:hypothetical protein